MKSLGSAGDDMLVCHPSAGKQALLAADRKVEYDVWSPVSRIEQVNPGCGPYYFIRNKSVKNVIYSERLHEAVSSLARQGLKGF